MFKRLYLGISLSMFSFLSFSNSAPKDLWIKQFGKSGDDVGASVTKDAKGNIYVAGVTSETLPGEVNLGSGDVFVRKYDSNGKVLWTRQFGSNKWDNALSVATDAKGNIYVAGRTAGTLSGQTNLGGFDAFLYKIAP